jgi:hypothetical protein
MSATLAVLLKELDPTYGLKFTRCSRPYVVFKQGADTTCAGPGVKRRNGNES